jgi:hypothetical protein
MNTQQLSSVNNLVAYTLSAASTIATLGASALGYSGPVGAVMTAGSIGYGVYSLLSRKTRPDPTPASTIERADEPDQMQITRINSPEQPVEPQTRDFSDEDDLQPLTEADLRQYPIEFRSYMVSERFQKLREIEARKEVLRDIIQLQYKAKNGERAVQKAITEQDKVTRELLAQSEGKKVEKGPVKKSTPNSQAPKEIRRDTNDIELEKVKLKVELTQKNLAENSQLVKSSSAPKSLQGKRKAGLNQKRH